MSWVRVPSPTLKKQAVSPGSQGLTASLISRTRQPLCRDGAGKGRRRQPDSLPLSLPSGCLCVRRSQRGDTVWSPSVAGHGGELWRGQGGGRVRGGNGQERTSHPSMLYHAG